MIHLVVNKSTLEFKFCKGVPIIVDEFEELSTKRSSIEKRFVRLKNNNQPLIIDDWGFTIYRGQKIYRNIPPGNKNIGGFAAKKLLTDS